MTNREFKLLILGILVLIGSLKLNGYDINEPIPNKQTISIRGIRRINTTIESTNNSKQKPRAQEKVSKSSWVPPEGSITITPKDSTKRLEDIVNIKIKDWGFTHELGLQTALFQPSLGLDCKIFFFHRAGLNIGLLGSNQFTTVVSPTISGSYRLHYGSWINNTEIWAGFVPLAPIPYQLGLRINL